MKNPDGKRQGFFILCKLKNSSTGLYPNPPELISGGLG
jgi:hypothetical protein